MKKKKKKNQKYSHENQKKTKWRRQLVWKKEATHEEMKRKEMFDNRYLRLIENRKNK